ncbi:MAG TPA: dienelactone hydrolase family protein [Candidatus Baltobacteraceae bacterium]|nr:dienelactone hydrolase family protein [Candidatus Baltobacteraceae bacterium]
MGQNIEFTRPDGNSAPAYYAAPERNADSAPGIVVVAEWWGVTPDIMRIADEYASLGYRALVPDLYRGRSAAVGDEANHLMEGLDFGDAALQDVRGALQHLKKNGKRAGVSGYCMGGAIAFITAMHVKEIDAAVVYYGFPPSEAGDPATIEIPLQCHFAKYDDFFTPDRAAEIEERMTQGKVPFEVYWYDAKHAFCNPNQPGQAGLGHYDAKAAHDAWERTVRFWSNTLKG